MKYQSITLALFAALALPLATVAKTVVSPSRTDGLANATIVAEAEEVADASTGQSSPQCGRATISPSATGLTLIWTHPSTAAPSGKTRHKLAWGMTRRQVTSQLETACRVSITATGFTSCSLEEEDGWVADLGDDRLRFPTWLYFYDDRLYMYTVFFPVESRDAVKGLLQETLGSASVLSMQDESSEEEEAEVPKHTSYSWELDNVRVTLTLSENATEDRLRVTFEPLSRPETPWDPWTN